MPEPTEVLLEAPETKKPKKSKEASVEHGDILADLERLARDGFRDLDEKNRLIEALVSEKDRLSPELHDFGVDILRETARVKKRWFEGFRTILKKLFRRPKKIETPTETLSPEDHRFMEPRFYRDRIERIRIALDVYHSVADVYENLSQIANDLDTAIRKISEAKGWKTVDEALEKVAVNFFQEVKRKSVRRDDGKPTLMADNFKTMHPRLLNIFERQISEQNAKWSREDRGDLPGEYKTFLEHEFDWDKRLELAKHTPSDNTPQDLVFGRKRHGSNRRGDVLNSWEEYNVANMGVHRAAVRVAGLNDGWHADKPDELEASKVKVNEHIPQFVGEIFASLKDYPPGLIMALKGILGLQTYYYHPPGPVQVLAGHAVYSENEKKYLRQQPKWGPDYEKHIESGVAFDTRPPEVQKQILECIINLGGSDPNIAMIITKFITHSNGKRFEALGLSAEDEEKYYERSIFTPGNLSFFVEELAHTNNLAKCLNLIRKNNYDVPDLRDKNESGLLRMVFVSGGAKKILEDQSLFPDLDTHEYAVVVSENYETMKNDALYKWTINDLVYEPEKYKLSIDDRNFLIKVGGEYPSVLNVFFTLVFSGKAGDFAEEYITEMKKNIKTAENIESGYSRLVQSFGAYFISDIEVSTQSELLDYAFSHINEASGRALIADRLRLVEDLHKQIGFSDQQAYRTHAARVDSGEMAEEKSIEDMLEPNNYTDILCRQVKNSQVADTFFQNVFRKSPCRFSAEQMRNIWEAGAKDHGKFGFGHLLSLAEDDYLTANSNETLKNALVQDALEYITLPDGMEAVKNYLSCVTQCIKQCGFSDVATVRHFYKLAVDSGREAAAAEIEKWKVESKSLIGSKLPEALRASPGYMFAVKYIFPDGNYSNYDDNLACGDKLEHVSDYVFDRIGYPIEMSGLKGYKLRPENQADDAVFESYQKRLGKIRKHIEERGPDNKALQADFDQLVAAKFEESAHPSFKTLDGLSPKEKLFSLFVSEVIQKSAPKDGVDTHQEILDLAILYKYAYHEDLEAYVRRTADAVQKFRDDDSQRYLMLTELTTIYGENMKHVLRHNLWEDLSAQDEKNGHFDQIIDCYNQAINTVAETHQLKPKQLQRIQQTVANEHITLDDEVIVDKSGAEKVKLGKFSVLKKQVKDIFGTNINFTSDGERESFESELFAILEPLRANVSMDAFEAIVPRLFSLREAYRSNLAGRLEKVFTADMNALNTELAKYEEVLEVEGKETAMGGPKDKEVKKSAKKRQIRGYFTKTKETANARMGAYLCIAGDQKMWDNENYFEFVMKDETTGKCVGLSMLLRIKADDGKKYLWMGPNPFESFLTQVRADVCLDYIYDTVSKFAKENGFDGIVIPAAEGAVLGACTNRGGTFPDLINAKRLRGAKGESKVVSFGQNHNLGGTYGYSDGALIWEKGESGKKK